MCAAILLFPIDIALRRLLLRIEDVPDWRAALKRAPAAPLAAEATVTRLRERVTDVRAARTPKPEQPPEPVSNDPTGELRARRQR